MLPFQRIRPADIVRALSPGGGLFAVGVVICLLLVSLGDVLDSALLGETGLEVGLFDLGGVLFVVVLQHWPLLQLLLAGGVLAAGLAVLSAAARPVLKVLRSTPPSAIYKIPI
jgi:hypothetical protein